MNEVMRGRDHAMTRIALARMGISLESEWGEDFVICRWRVQDECADRIKLFHWEGESWVEKGEELVFDSELVRAESPLQPRREAVERLADKAKEILDTS